MHSPLILEITQNFPANLRKDMDTLLSKQDYAPVWQTIEWQLMLQSTGYAKKSFFVWIYKAQNLVSYALVEKRSVGMGLFGLFSVGGPVGSDSGSWALLGPTLGELARKEDTVFVQAEPLTEMVLKGFKPGEYKHFIEKHTAIIDLGQDEEVILAKMKPKGRYNIGVAKKAGVSIEQVPYSEANLDIFYGLLGETLERDGFAANSREYFRIFLQYLEKQGLGGLFLATRENEVIAWGVFVYYKNTAYYYYGASSSDNAKRKYMATYLLQWYAIQEGQKRGCKTFDFLGIADPADTNSPLAGVTDFKLKLTNETRVWPASELLVSRRFMYIMLVLRKKLKKLISR